MTRGFASRTLVRFIIVGFDLSLWWTDQVVSIGECTYRYMMSPLICPLLVESCLSAPSFIGRVNVRSWPKADIDMSGTF